MSWFLITGKGLKMAFDGSVYEKEDQAALEEGLRLSKNFKNVKVVKITTSYVQIILNDDQKEKEKQRIRQNIAKFCHPCPRRR